MSAAVRGEPGGAVGAPVAAERPLRTGRGRRRPWLKAARYLVVAVALAFFLFPIAWAVGTAFKLPAEYLSNPPVWFPREPTLLHFRRVFEGPGQLAIKNSLIISGSATLLSLVAGAAAAYALARFRTGGRHLAFWLLSQRMMPPVVLVIPFFLLLRELGQRTSLIGIDTHGALIALYTAANLPYVIWMMRSYFAGIPVEIEESALVDGSSRWAILWRITLPLALPGLVATATFAFIFNWTEFLFAVVFTRTEAVTLPVTIANFTGTQGSNWGQAAALAVVTSAPLFALGLLVQKHFVRGLTLGAVRT